MGGDDGFAYAALGGAGARFVRPAGIGDGVDLLRRRAAGDLDIVVTVKADREGTKSIIGKFTRLNDPEGLERTYRNYTSVLLDAPYADPAGSKTLLDDMAPKNPKAAAAAQRIIK
ncbi:MAG: hypothetical protein FJ143_11570 [Deltaproteobacteria bacterium]|nr:hypothetical protein [Deltaproteobacteria bacterium]